MPKAIDIRKGQVIEWDGRLWVVTEATRVSKGNWRSYIQVKLKDFKTGNGTEQRFGIDDKLETPHVQDKPFEYLYREGDSFVLMDTETYDQVPVSKDLMPDAEYYLKGNERLTCKLIEGSICGVELPNVVELKVAETADQVKGATATNQNKEAIMESGLKIRVPPFIQIGEVLRIDTRTGEYLERA